MQLYTVYTWRPQQNQIQERELVKRILNSFPTNFNSRSSRVNNRSKRISLVINVSVPIF